MNRFFFISILALTTACRPAYQSLQAAKADETCIRKFKPVFKADLYSTSIDVIGKHISGLLLFKTMPDSAVRLVFTNEAGVKFFDFEFRKHGQFTVMQVIPQLDKKPAIKTLRKDFELMMMSFTDRDATSYQQEENILFAFPNRNETDCVIVTKGCESLVRLEKTGRRKIKGSALLFGEPGHAPDSVLISHTTFKMDINLKRLVR